MAPECFDVYNTAITAKAVRGGGEGQGWRWGVGGSVGRLTAVGAEGRGNVLVF